MFINELPEECLLIIFGLINELDDLLNCFKVCSKWSYLIVERTKTVKYLVEHQDWWNGETSPSYPFDYVYYRTTEPIDGTCLSTLFPSLMIADFSGGLCQYVNPEDIVTLVQKLTSLKGLMYEFDDRDESIFQYCDQLEMVATDYIAPCMEKIGVNIKQLHLWIYPIDLFMENAHYFPNLERLLIFTEEGQNWNYDGPIFKRLKIVQFCSDYFENYDDYSGFYYGFKFMDSCPNLQSAFIHMSSNHIFVDESLKHKSLQDLVIEFYDSISVVSFNWKVWKSLFMKYPSLKHLALRSFRELENKHVKQLVRILPNLVLFDVDACPRVTQKAAKYVQDYNKLHGRSIKFYYDGNYHEIQSDWPQLSTKNEKISQGFDFMKHCFLKGFYSLPKFLISNED